MAVAAVTTTVTANKTQTESVYVTVEADTVVYALQTTRTGSCGHTTGKL